MNVLGSLIVFGGLDDNDGNINSIERLGANG